MEGILNYFNNQLDNIKKIMSEVDAFKNKLKGNQQDLSTINLQPKKERVMKYKGISIHKNKYCDTWYTRFRSDGRQHYISAKTQNECYLKLKQALKNIENSRLYGNVAVQREFYGQNPIARITLMEWTNKWLKTYKENKVRETTYKGIYYLIRNHFNDKIFDMDITQVMPLDIENFLNTIEFERVRENAYIYLKDIFNKALDNRLIEHNPMQSMKKPKHEKKEKRALTIEEQSKFELLCSTDEKYTLLLVALWQGLRLGELRALEWADIDFEKDEINVSKSESEDGDLRTKNKYSNRSVPLFPNTKALLQKYYKTNKSERPFYHTKNYINKILNEVLNKLNIKGITMHSLRHTFVTRCQEKNVQLYILQNWIGHAQGSAVTTRVYTHKQKEAELDAINKVIGK